MSPSVATTSKPVREVYWIPPATPGDRPVLRVRERPVYVPMGYRVAANGFDLELVAHPDWRTQPFNKLCTGRTMPNEALLSEARLVMPDFAPDSDLLAWSTLGELIRGWTGRSDEQLTQMTQEEVVAALRAHRLQRCGSLPCDRPVRRTKEQPAANCSKREQPPARKIRVNERLMAFAATNLREAIELPLEKLGGKIGCTKAAFYRSKFFNETLNPLREKPARKGRPAECYGAEDKQSKRNYAAAEKEREAIDRRLDAEMMGSRR
jgi:hypothetical protein